jgi:hypothetical protein
VPVRLRFRDVSLVNHRFRERTSIPFIAEIFQNDARFQKVALSD